MQISFSSGEEMLQYLDVLHGLYCRDKNLYVIKNSDHICVFSVTKDRAALYDSWCKKTLGYEWGREISEEETIYDSKQSEYYKSSTRIPMEQWCDLHCSEVWTVTATDHPRVETVYKAFPKEFPVTVLNKMLVYPTIIDSVNEIGFAEHPRVFELRAHGIIREIEEKIVVFGRLEVVREISWDEVLKAYD